MMQCVKGTGMILQLREIFQIEGMHLPVDYTISLEELSEVRGYTFAAPVSVQGEFSNRAGIVTLKYTVSCTLDAVCDRCLAELRRDYSYDFSHTVVPSLQSEGDIYDTYLLAQHDSIDMNETAISVPLSLLSRRNQKKCPFRFGVRGTSVRNGFRVWSER